MLFIITLEGPHFALRNLSGGYSKGYSGQMSSCFHVHVLITIISSKLRSDFKISSYENIFGSMRKLRYYRALINLI